MSSRYARNEVRKYCELTRTQQMSSFLEKVEGYAEIEGAILRATKIHKVLKAMMKLDSIPMDETYQFTSRSQKLLGRWNKVLADEPAPSDKDAEKKSDGGAGEEKDAEKSADKAKSDEKAEAATEPVAEKAAESADAKVEKSAVEKPAESSAKDGLDCALPQPVLPDESDEVKDAPEKTAEATEAAA
jgi:hypothetical protein